MGVHRRGHGDDEHPSIPQCGRVAAVCDSRQLGRIHLLGEVDAPAQLLDPIAIDVETDHIEVASELDRQGKPDVAEAQDGDGRIHGARLVAARGSRSPNGSGTRSVPALTGTVERAMAGAGVRTHEVGSVPFAVLPFDAAVDEVVRRATNGRSHRRPLRQCVHHRSGGQRPRVRRPVRPAHSPQFHGRRAGCLGGKASVRPERTGIGPGFTGRMSCRRCSIVARKSGIFFWVVVNRPSRHCGAQ